MSTTDTPGSTWTAPYASWLTLKNTIGRMSKDGGVPARIDRSYLTNLPGSAQGEIQTTLKALDLVDAQLHPTDLLGRLVGAAEENRPGIVKEIVTAKYVLPLALGPMATQSQLEDAFRKLGVTGSTLRKAIRFFMNAAKYAEIPLSPHFKAPTAETTIRKPRKPRTSGQDVGGGDDQSIAVQTPPVSNLHPFIQGLVDTLPGPGSAFPSEKQEAWFDTARGIFRLIYTTGSDSPKEARPEPSLAGGGDSD